MNSVIRLPVGQQDFPRHTAFILTTFSGDLAGLVFPELGLPGLTFPASAGLVLPGLTLAGLFFSCLTSGFDLTGLADFGDGILAGDFFLGGDPCGVSATKCSLFFSGVVSLYVTPFALLASLLANDFFGLSGDLGGVWGGDSMLVSSSNLSWKRNQMDVHSMCLEIAPLTHWPLGDLTTVSN